MAIDEENAEGKIERACEGEKKYEKEIRRIEVQVSTKHATSPPHRHAQCREVAAPENFIWWRIC